MRPQLIGFLQQIADAHSCCFAVKNVQHQYIVANDVFANTVGLISDDLIGKNDLDVGIAEKYVHGDSASDITGIWTLDDIVFISGESRQDPDPRLSQTTAGSEIHHTTRTPLTDERGRVVALLLVSSDLSSNDVLQKNLKESLSAHEDQFSVLHNLMVQMMAFQELDPLLQHIAEIMIQLTGANNALILLVDETQEFMQVVASAGSHSKQNLGQRREPGAGFAGIAWSTGQTQYILNSDSNPKTKGYWPPNTQLIAVPLLNGNAVIGVAVLGTAATETKFSSATGLVNSLAGLAGIAITSAQSFEQSRSEIKRTRALSEISQQLASFDDVDSIFDSISRTLVDAIDISQANSFKVNKEGNLVAYASWKREYGNVVAAETTPLAMVPGTICHWSYTNGQFAHIKRNQVDARESSQVHEFKQVRNIGSTLSLPVTSGKRTVGVLSISREHNKRDFDENEINLFISVVNQVSSAVYGYEMSEALQHQVYHDSLTGLPNRRYFESELQQELDRQESLDTLGAVMFLDLDGFKSVNDSLGHTSGDELLRLVAQRLSNSSLEQSLLARIGGDEFAVIAKQLDNPQQAMAFAKVLTESLCLPFHLSSGNVTIGASIGLSFFPTDGMSADELLHNADEAMYHAKDSGKNRVVRYEPYMGEDTRNRTQLEVEMQIAIEKKQFMLLFQPQIDVHQGTVVGIEALIRWQHPERGFISPAEFIPVAEETGMINQIGAWVLTEAISHLGDWKDTIFRKLRIGVNIAVPQLLQKGFADDVLTKLSDCQVCPSKLELEVTESVFMKDMESVIYQLNKLRAAGVRVAIDDFGTGYSSLSYLQNLPLDVLKIDRSFITTLENAQGQYSLVSTINLLANGLKLETVAEGVETSTQLDMIMQLGCHLVQGFYFAKPCSLSDLPEVIKNIEHDLHLKAQSKAYLKAG